MGKLMLAAGIIALTATPALGFGPGKGPKHRGPHGSAYGTPCPPGLAKKGCMPPGQAKKLYGAGQRLPSGYRYLDVPQRYRDQIDYDDRYRYYYDDGRVYVVDPTTRLIQDVIRLIL